MATKDEKNLILIHGYCRIESSDMNIIDGIISIIFKYYKCATWSTEFIGSKMTLEDNETKAVCMEGSGHSVRANFFVGRGEIVSWELKCYIMYSNCNFFGVISSKQTDFNTCPHRSMPGGYGIDDSPNYGYQNGTVGMQHLNWQKPKLPTRKEIILKMTADWSHNQCKLTIFYNDEKLNKDNDQYTILLPELDDKYVWYPCVTPYNEDAYCVINYA